uniref:VRR-NUC domain-containing protein n=1 Tax=Cellvibrio fontiphilus TaxID=1815559 RepID=UPI002B4BDD5E|nr:VRR-NUC domain-containing protein [Cellvibrio fontiphilus]
MNNSIATTPDLAPDYYLKNFRFLVEWVDKRYADLLSAEEQHFIQQFYQLDTDAQCLLVRLSSRKGPLFRRDKLNYREITSIDTAAQSLIEAGLLTAETPISLEVLSGSLTKPELLLLFEDQLVGVKQARKEMLIQHIANQFIEPRTWLEWTNNQLGTAWYLDNQQIIRTLLLLFFGNAYQDLTEFVLQDLGIYRYEHYPIDSQHRIFKNRTELEQYLHLVALREQLDKATDIESLIQLSEQLPQQCVTEKLQRRRAKLCNQLAYELERGNEHELAFQLYQQSHLSPARERRIRLLEKTHRYSEAWELLNQLIAEPQDEQELQVAQRIAPRLAKKQGINFEKQTPTATTTHHLELAQITDDSGNTLRVEEVVRLTLDDIEAPCVYAENTLISALFGLWLWPEMFRSIEGAFANPFQAAPLDLYQENFVSNRPDIATLWALLETDEYRQHIRHIWSEKHGIANHFVNWSFMTNDLLDLALECIPAHHLRLIFKRLLFDVKNNRSGLPDLIQFYPAKKTYRMIEVKGPGDRVQDNQQRWLDYFAKQNIPAEVWYVRWQ